MIVDYAKRIAVVFLFSVVLLLIMNGLTIAISGLEANETAQWPVMNDTLLLTVSNGYRL